MHLLDQVEGRAPRLHLGQDIPRVPDRIPTALQVLQTSTPSLGSRYPLLDEHVPVPCSISALSARR